MKLHRRQWLLLAVLICLLLAVSAAADSQQLLSLLSQVTTEPLFSGEQAALTVDGVDFYGIQVPELLLSAYPGTDGALPGERSEAVQAAKEALQEAVDHQFVSHTQLRPEVIDLFDSHLETLVQTLYDFCQLDRTPRMDALTSYLLNLLPELPAAMQADIYTVYKARLIDAGLDGSLLRSGESLPFYYYAQTDPDWASYPFPNANSSSEQNDTMQNRSCGVMSVSMVISQYLHEEIDPLWLADYVVDNGYRVTAHGVLDEFMPVAAGLYGLPAPEIYYQEPADGQEAIDWDYVRTMIAEENAMVIVHMYRGNYTSAQHYMVLEDYMTRDGIDYYLIADPYQLRSRYSEWGTSAMADAGLNDEGLILSTPELVAETCSAVIVFPQDKTDWTVTRQSEAAVQLPLGGDDHA